MPESRTVLVSTDFGLEPFTTTAVELDESNTPHNLMSGTEYAVLDSSQGEAFTDGEFELRSEDEIRHIGAFSLLFANPPSEVQSQTK